MAEDAPEQSMEDVLASIKRIISADVEAARRFPKPSGLISAAEEEGEDILELGEAPAAAPAPSKGLVSGKAAKASKAALAALDSVRIDPAAGANTMDGLVREMLKPMLKEWLDANLPDLVERVVAREVARIIGR
jgi:cell pole-organizing protein PopZ